MAAIPVNKVTALGQGRTCVGRFGFEAASSESLPELRRFLRLAFGVVVYVAAVESEVAGQLAVLALGARAGPTSTTQIGDAKRGLDGVRPKRGMACACFGVADIVDVWRRATSVAIGIAGIEGTSMPCYTTGLTACSAVGLNRGCASASSVVLKRLAKTSGQRAVFSVDDARRKNASDPRMGSRRGVRRGVGVRTRNRRLTAVRVGDRADVGGALGSPVVTPLTSGLGLCCFFIRFFVVA